MLILIKGLQIYVKGRSSKYSDEFCNVFRHFVTPAPYDAYGSIDLF